MVAPAAVQVPPFDRPIDLVQLTRATLGDRALEREVLGLFVRQTMLQLDRLQAAPDAAAFRAAAHTLKGSALGVGAQAVAELAGEAERVAEADPAERLAVVAALSARVTEAHLYIAGILAADR